MREIRVKRKILCDDLKKKQGLFYSLSSDEGSEKGTDHTETIHPFWTVIDEDCRIVDDDTGDIVFIMKKEAIPEEQCKATYDILLPAAKSNANSNRGIAGGLLDMDKVRTARPNFKVGKQTAFRVYPMLKDGQVGKTHYCNPVSSSIVGWTDIPKRDEKSVKCRLTAFTAKHFDKFKGTFPFFKSMDAVYQDLAPEHYERQRQHAGDTVALISDTVFSTITVNHIFRSALHRDAGDYKEGLGGFAVHQKGDGGELLFPEYGLAARVSTGDVLLFNSHLWHCTAPVKAKDRLTFVCYLRVNIPKNCPMRQNVHE